MHIFRLLCESDFAFDTYRFPQRRLLELSAMGLGKTVETLHRYGASAEREKQEARGKRQEAKNRRV